MTATTYIQHLYSLDQRSLESEIERNSDFMNASQGEAVKQWASQYAISNWVYADRTGSYLYDPMTWRCVLDENRTE